MKKPYHEFFWWIVFSNVRRKTAKTKAFSKIKRE